MTRHPSVDASWVGAQRAGHIRRARRELVRRGPLADSLIATLAWRMDATVVTRNPGDFEVYGA